MLFCLLSNSAICPFSFSGCKGTYFYNMYYCFYDKTLALALALVWSWWLFLPRPRLKPKLFITFATRKTKKHVKKETRTTYN